MDTDLIIVGAGPAGLACAEVAAGRGLRVLIVDAMPGAGRKFLVAGKSGLNLTHDSDADGVLARVGSAAPRLAACVRAFPPSAIRQWAADLETPTFVGTSGKVFPDEHHAAGLLHRWCRRLDGLGVERRHSMPLGGIEAGPAIVAGGERLQARSIVLACGGGSWPQTGSDGSWMPLLAEHGIPLRPFQAANCGVDLAEDAVLRSKAGQAIKDVEVRCGDQTGVGELVLTENGCEGNALYPVIPALRDGNPLSLDLCRRRSAASISERLSRAAGKASIGNRLRKALKLTPAAVALLHHACPDVGDRPPGELAQLLKALPLQTTGLRPLAEAISSADGVAWQALDSDFQLQSFPGIYCVGEMVDWEAPTGGWLLSVCMAMGRWVGGVVPGSQS